MDHRIYICIYEIHGLCLHKSSFLAQFAERRVKHTNRWIVPLARVVIIHSAK